MNLNKKFKDFFFGKCEHIRSNLQISLTQLQANAPFLYPLKTSEKLWFCDDFSEYRNGTLAWKRLNLLKGSFIKFTENFHFVQ